MASVEIHSPASVGRDRLREGISRVLRIVEALTVSHSTVHVAAFNHSITHGASPTAYHAPIADPFETVLNDQWEPIERLRGRGSTSDIA